MTYVNQSIKEVLEELNRARQKHPKKFNSPHEGWAVIREELDELWEEVKHDTYPLRLREEAIQVAATALRFIEDLC